ncbi:T6SS immunity protein Tli4 family protein [Providencia rustigianii]|uniref:T6SS immunity protein Tli4 family protein n=1 Tax=Providencia rustigianii TaxID=158850 RepID=UPI0015599309|nr:T6SS immunity protein Tli4 family protein [Providencia rustigianii]
MQIKPNKIKTYITSLGVIIIFIITGFWLKVEFKEPILKNEGDMMINELFKDTKPQCIGRYIIDIPISFNNKISNVKYIDEFKIESKFIYPPAFKQRVELREKELRESNASLENSPVLKRIIQLPDSKGIIFDRNQPNSNDSYRTLEAHVYVNHIAFIITTDILDLSDPKYSDEKKSYIEVSGFSEADTDNSSIKLSDMQSLISRLSGRLDNEIPKDKGTCIPNGFILDDNKPHKNDIYFLYENDNFRISINTSSNNQSPNDSLLTRESEGRNTLMDNNKKTLRINDINYNGINSQEWLISGEQAIYNEIKNKVVSDYPYYYFRLETSLPTSPLLSISMYNTEMETIYSQAQMIEIWDRVVGSLRYKPNAF